VQDFHSLAGEVRVWLHIDFRQRILRKAASGAGFARNPVQRCTISGHALVDGVHSIENTRIYNVQFFVD
jgi:hypothetical protein